MCGVRVWRHDITYISFPTFSSIIIIRASIMESVLLIDSALQSRRTSLVYSSFIFQRYLTSAIN